MKRYGRPKLLVTDRLRSYGAAMKVVGVVDRQVCGQWLNNRAENSHQPFRRREGAMARFRAIRIPQKFAAAHASIHNHFNHDRHLTRRFKSVFPLQHRGRPYMTKPIGGAPGQIFAPMPRASPYSFRISTWQGYSPCFSRRFRRRSAKFSGTNTTPSGKRLLNLSRALASP